MQSTRSKLEPVNDALTMDENEDDSADLKGDLNSRENINRRHELRDRGGRGGRDAGIDSYTDRPNNNSSDKDNVISRSAFDDIRNNSASPGGKPKGGFNK